MGKKLYEESNIQAIAGAIRAKMGGSDTYRVSDMPAAIGEIETGVDTSDATAGSEHIVAPYTAYVKGAKVTGNIPSKSSSDLTVSGAKVSVPAGHYASAASKSVTTATQATPSISVDSAGKITASATQSAGYVSAGTKSATKQLTTKGATTYTPSTSDQTIPAGTYLTGAQTIKGDENLTAENIAEGVSIFGIIGTFASGGTSIDSGTVICEGDLFEPLDELTIPIDYVPSLLIIMATSMQNNGLIEPLYRVINNGIENIVCNTPNLPSHIPDFVESTGENTLTVVNGILKYDSPSARFINGIYNWYAIK